MIGLLVLAVWFNLGTSHVCNVSYDNYYGGLFAHCEGKKLDEIPGDFPDNIVALDFSWNALRSLKNFTFRRYRNLTYINLKDNYLDKLEPYTFYGVPHLSVLNLAGNYIGTLNSLDIIQPLTGGNMSMLDMSSNFPKSFVASSKNNFQLTTNDTKYLTQICMKEFVFRKNRLVYIEEDALFGEPFASCLEMLDLSSNMLIGNGKILLESYKFTRLKRLIIAEQNVFHITDLPRQSLHSLPIPRIFVTVPSTLEYLDISSIGEHPSDMEMDWINATNLKTFISRYNRMSGQFRMHGLDNVEKVDLSGNSIGIVNTSFLDFFPNVTNLSLRNCQLRFLTDTHLILKELKLIQYFDISQNFLTVLPTLSDPAYIKMLNLSGNAFENLPLAISTFLSLKTLDLSYNSIAYLSVENRIMLDEAFLKTNLSLHLRGNTFSCGCQHLDFILWLRDSRVIRPMDRDIPCMQDDGNITGTIHVIENYVRISRRCNGKMSLVLTVTLIIISLMSFIAIYIVAQNPYRYQNLILRLIGFTFFLYTPKHFKFKFYIGYCEADIPFVYQKLRPALELSDNPVRLFLKDREVLPGVDIADGIVEGINNSWKTLIVVSRDFLNDTWSNFTMNTAIHSMTEQIPDRVIVLLVGDVQIRDLPETLLNAVDENSIFLMQEYEKNEQSLWRCFKEMNT